MARKNVLNRAVESPAAEEPSVVDGMVKVRALRWVGEDGVQYPPGAEFVTTEERAGALVNGGNVEILK
jgi:hypothetical protein